MMKAVYKFVITAILMVSVSLVHANGLTQMSLKEGIAGVSVTDFHEDKSGLMWIATSNGINLYDGINIQTYRLENTETKNPVLVYRISISDSGNVYAATNTGLFVLMKGENHFKRICPNINFAEWVLAHKDKIYIGNRQGIFCMNERNTSKLLNIDKKNLETNNSVRCILADPQGNIWFTTRYHLNRYTPSTGKIKRIHIPDASGLKTFAFCAGKIFIGSSSNGIYAVFQSLKGGWRKVGGNFNVIRNLRSNTQGNRLYIATDGTGAYIMDGKTEKITEHYGTREDETHRLSSDAILAFDVDSQGNKWLGTFRYGLFHTHNQHALFHTFQCLGFTSAGINVLSYLILKDKVVLGTNGGFYVIDLKSQKSTFHSTAEYGMFQIKNITEYKGEIYICSLDHGMIVYNPITQGIHSVPQAPQLSQAAITNCAKDKSGRLWITSSDGIFVFDGTHITTYNDSNSRIYGGVKSIAFDPNDNVWFSTLQGLCIFIKKDGSVKNSDFPEGFNKVEKLFLKSSKDMMYAYGMNRIYYTNSNMTQYGEFTLPNGILEETCSDLLPDSHGCLWLVTEQGLFLYNPANQFVAHLSDDAAISFEGINTRTMSLSTDGKLWIGTNDGLKYMNLKDFQAYCVQSKATIMPGNIAIGNQPVSNADFLQIVRNHQIELSWNLLSSTITLSPHILGKFNNDNDVFEYKLGDNGDWKRVTSGKLSIKGLGLGHHRLSLRVAGTQHITEYDILVKPSWLVWLEAIIAIGFITLLIMWKRYVKNTRAIISEHQETEKALIEEYHSAQTSPEKEEQTQEQEGKKYAKSRQSQKELAKIAHSMEQYIKKEKPYLNAELKMSDIAAQIHVSPSKLSQVFSLYLNMSYYDYINQFRLTEFKHLITQKLHKKLTVTAISEQCGFKKTSFFGTFRKLEGMTPTEYIQKQ